MGFKIGLKELGQFSFKKRKWSGDIDNSLQTQEDCCREEGKNLFCVFMIDGTWSHCRQEMQLRCEDSFLKVKTVKRCTNSPAVVVEVTGCL